MLLKDRTAIVTGAASPRGIGRATAHLFAGHGARVAILDLDGAKSEAAAAGLAGTGHLGVACDVTDAASCTAAIDRVLKASGGRIDVLVNIAGIAQSRRLLDVAAADYDAVLDVNLRGTLLVMQAVVPAMRKARSGSIVNMDSVAAQRGGGIFGGPHYAAAKGGVLGLTKAAARELAPDNVRVNAVCPSLIDTDIVHSGPGWTAEREAEVLATIPMGRTGRPDEVAGCCLFLASDLSTYVTGTELDVNGGSHIH